MSWPEQDGVAGGMAGFHVLLDFCSLEQQSNNTQQFVFQIQQSLNSSLSPQCPGVDKCTEFPLGAVTLVFGGPGLARRGQQSDQS